MTDNLPVPVPDGGGSVPLPAVAPASGGLSPTAGRASAGVPAGRRAEIEAAMRDGSYWSSPAMRREYRMLIESEQANAPGAALMAAQTLVGANAADAGLGYSRAMLIASDLGDVATDVDESLRGLPVAARVSMLAGICARADDVPPVSAALCARFAETGVGKLAATAWKDETPIRLARLGALRNAAIRHARQHGDEYAEGVGEWINYWIDYSLQSDAERVAVLDRLSA